MPNHKNARKALRQNKTHAERNKVALAEIHSLRVRLRKAITSKQGAEASEFARLVGKKLDKAVQKNLIKLNAA